MKTEIVKEIEATLKNLEKNKDYKIKVLAKQKMVIFTLIKNGKIKIGTSQCMPSDKFDEGIGTLIAMRKAYNKSISDISCFLPTNAYVYSGQFADNLG